MQTSKLDCNWSDVGSPGSRATSFHTCQVLRPRRVAQALALTSVLPSASQRRRHPGYESLRGSMAGLCAPLPTLRRRPYGLRRTARGRYGSLLLHRIGLAPAARCRSPGALRKIPYLIRTNRALGSVVADLQRAVVKVARERGPAGTGIADCFGHFAAAVDRREQCVKECGEIIHDGAR